MTSKEKLLENASAGPTFSWNSKPLNWVILCASICACAFFPFAAFYILLLLVILTSGMHAPRREIVIFLCIACVLTMGPFIALKVPLDNGGNDKIQYLDFMRDFAGPGLFNFMAVQPELVSFLTLWVAWKAFGPSDMAFLFIFALSFGLTLRAVWQIDHRAVPLFILLLISSSAFFSSFGNVIRQAMAFPLLIMLVCARTKRAMMFLVLLTTLAHIPSLLITIPYIGYRLVGKWALRIAPIIAVGVFIFTTHNMDALNSFGNDDGYVSRKLNIYTNWDEYSVVSVAITASIIFILNNFVWWKFGKRVGFEIGSSPEWNNFRFLRVASNLAFLLMLATYNLSKVFERIYIYFFVISIIYLVLSIARSRSGPTKTVIIMGAMSYSIVSFAKNLQVNDLFFGGDPVGFLTASFLHLYQSFI